ncbi:MAG: citrate/2-methylcitrate synthase [Microthrixaceae bacterium]
MTTYVRAAEAARILGISKATLYAYVSRGRVGRTTAADGRTSLFALDELEALSSRSRGAVSPRPSIDVQIASAITVLGEDGVSVRGHDLGELVAAGTFEDVAELLWSGRWEPGTTWPSAARGDAALIERCLPQDAPPGTRPGPVPRLAIAAHVLDGAHPGDDVPTAARRLLLAAPRLFGSTRTSGRYAHRIAGAVGPDAGPQLVSAIDTALCLLADHELATSTLAVRVAASVRTSPYGAIAAGLAVVDGVLHGSASLQAGRFLAECEADGVGPTVRRYLDDGRLIPGFGHKVYRGVDPRFGPLLDAVRSLDDRVPAPPSPAAPARATRAGARVELIDEVVAEVGRLVPKHPNIDLALGALGWMSGVDADLPLFAIARIAGWAAHYAEELDEAPVRYRGLARTP